MEKDPIDKSNYDVSKEYYYFPTDEAEKLENHILGESMHMDYLDYDKIQRQRMELDDLEKSRQEFK